MKVKKCKTGAILDVNASYGARLIEQGKAFLFKEKGKKEGAPKKEAAPRKDGA